jgi:hypothetical protein
MDCNDKLLADLAAQLGLGSSGPSGQGGVPKGDRISDLADQYKGKSDQELIGEIMKVKHGLKRDKAQFENQMRTIKTLRSVLGGEQRARLEQLIRLLEEED